MNKEKGICEECETDDGIILSYNTRRSHLEIQKCDTCQRFDSDLEAWKYVKPIDEKMKKEYRIVHLAKKVLAVAVLNYEDEECKKLSDWCVYIDAVQGYNHDDEFKRVATHGVKQPIEMTKFLFPDVDIEKYRR